MMAWEPWRSREQRDTDHGPRSKEVGLALARNKEVGKEAKIGIVQIHWNTDKYIDTIMDLDRNWYRKQLDVGMEFKKEGLT